MTRKDYIKIANIIVAAHFKHDREYDMTMEIALDFAYYLKKDNPKFDYTKFINYIKEDL